MPPQGVPGHRQASLSSFSDPALALDSLPMAAPPSGSASRLPFLLGCLPGQGNQVTCCDLSQRGGAGEQVLP